MMTDGHVEYGPSRTAALAARNGMEMALFALPEIPAALDRAGVKERLLRAIQLMYTVIDTSPLSLAHANGLTEGQRLVEEVAVLLASAGDRRAILPLDGALTALASAARTLQEATDAIAHFQLKHRSELMDGMLNLVLPPARPFCASHGVPQLHGIARQPLLPHIVVDAAVPLPEPARPPIAVPAPKSFEDLKALLDGTLSGELNAQLMRETEAAEGASAPEAPPPLAYEPAVEEAEMLRILGHDCLDDIAAGMSLRKANALESWLDQAPFEQRLLNKIDAFAAFGGSVLPLVALFHAEAKAPDPGRAFAVALTLGCIEGSDAVGAAVMTLKQSSPEEYAGWIEGFWLAPSPAVDVAMADLCTSSRPQHVALALDVLHARGRTPDNVVLALANHTDAGVATRVARALATALPREDAIERLEHTCATTEYDDLFLAAVESLLRRGHGPAVNLLRHAIDAPTSDARRRRALPLLCLVGRASDLNRLLTAANEAPTVPILRGIGRYGHVESLGMLLNFLEHEDADIVAAAAEALDRITGAELRETIEESWEVELPPEAEDVDAIPVPMRKVERIVTDPARWGAWVKDKTQRFDAKLKTRGGRPFSPMQIIDELAARASPTDQRKEAALELALATGIASPFSPHDWVARQKGHLADLQSQVAKLWSSSGAWSIAWQRQSAPDDVPAERPRQHLSTPPIPDDTPPFPHNADSHAADEGREAFAPPPPAPVPRPVVEPAMQSTPCTPAWPHLAQLDAPAPEESAESRETPPLPVRLDRPVLPFQPRADTARAPVGTRPAELVAEFADMQSSRLTPPAPEIPTLANPVLPFRSLGLQPMDPTLGPPFATRPAASVTPEITSTQPRSGALPEGTATPPRAPVPSRPPLTLEIHAALCAELEAFPGDEADILGHLGLDAVGWFEADQWWRQHLALSLAERRRWEQVYNQEVGRWMDRTRHGER